MVEGSWENYNTPIVQRLTVLPLERYNTMGKEDQDTMGNSVNIPWAEGQNTMGRGVKIPWVGNSVYHE